MPSSSAICLAAFSQLYPDPSVTHGKDCVEDGLQMTATDLHIDIESSAILNGRGFLLYT